MIKKLLLPSLFLLLLSTTAFATTYYSQGNSLWNWGGSTSHWNSKSDGSGTGYSSYDIATTQVLLTDSMIIQPGHIITLGGALNAGTLIIEPNAQLLSNNFTGHTIYILKELLVNGELGNGIPAIPGDQNRIFIYAGKFNVPINGTGTITLESINCVNCFSSPYGGSFIINTDITIYSYQAGDWYSIFQNPYVNNFENSCLSMGGMDFNLTINSGKTLTVYGIFNSDQTPGTNVNSRSRFHIYGTLDIKEGNILLSTENTTYDNVATVYPGGKIISPNPIIGTGASDDPNPQTGTKKSQLIIEGILETTANDPILYSDNNLSEITFQNGGEIKLKGSASQVLDHAATYYDVYMEGSGPKELSGDVTITNHLDLSNMPLILSSHNLSMTKMHTGGNTIPFKNYSSSNYIVTNGTGSVKAQVPSGGELSVVFFPIGSSTYNPIQLSNTFFNDYFSIRVDDAVLLNGNSGSPVTLNSINRTWYIEEEDPGGSFVKVKPYWSASQELSGFDREDCYISHYTSNAWDSNDQTSAVTELGMFTTVRDGFTDFSPFTVASNTPLPVELLSFTAVAKNNAALLEWSTATELNNRGFEIQRSTNGINWQVIGFEEGNGDTELISSYQYTDQRPYIGLNYYRLKQIDEDGKFEILPIKSVEFNPGKNNNVQLFPNPVNNFLQISHVSGTGAIYDLGGRLQMEVQLAAQQVNTIDVRSLPAGVYQLRLKDKSGNLIVRPFFK